MSAYLVIAIDFLVVDVSHAMSESEQKGKYCYFSKSTMKKSWPRVKVKLKLVAEEQDNTLKLLPAHILWRRMVDHFTPSRRTCNLSELLVIVC